MGQVISEEQKALNKALHAQDQNFGSRKDAGGITGNLPKALLELHSPTKVCSSILDYGTGKGRLVERLRKELPSTFKVSGYDPAVEDWDTKPDNPSDIVTCLDVLEHIEMDSIDAVLRDIYDLTGRFCYLVIDLQPAIKELADGRNAHILLAPPEWWVGRLSQVFPSVITFPLLHYRGLPQKLVILCSKKNFMIPWMFKFLGQLGIYQLKMNGGPLGSYSVKVRDKKENKSDIDPVEEDCVSAALNSDDKAEETITDD